MDKQNITRHIYPFIFFFKKKGGVAVWHKENSVQNCRQHKIKHKNKFFINSL